MENIRDIISGVIEKIAPNRGFQGLAARIQELWPQIVDDKAARHTRVAGFKNDQVLVLVDSSAWLYQMNLEKEKVLTRLKQDFPAIQGIFFKIGKVG